MTSEYILQLFREIHSAEKEQHERLNAQLSLPTAIVTLLCGTLAFYLDKVSNLPAKGGPGVFFVVCFVAFFLAVVAAIFFLILALVHYGYRHLSDPRDIHDYMQNMEAWYITIGTDGIAEKVERDLRELMTEQYMECAVRNRLMNSLKAKYIYFAKCAIIGALLFLAASLYPFYAGVRGADRVYKVQVIEAKEPANGR